jgi:peptide chain release factor 1
MKPNIVTKLGQLDERLDEVNRLLSDENATHDMDSYRKLNRERAELGPVVELYHAHQACTNDIATALQMASDPEMREFAESEVKQGRERLEEITVALQRQLLPKDQNDDRNVFLEVRAGTGGDEAALFSGDLFRMYVRFAERNHWQVEIVSESCGEKGGFKEIIARIVGHGAYSVLKFESGAHRVQRIPTTETQGRIHTSACTVAVLPEADEVSDIVLNPADLRIDTFRASGAGGQHINKTSSAVRLIHEPTGLVSSSQEERSQLQNRERAMTRLKAMIAARIEEEHEAERDRIAGKPAQVGWGSQIRSYVMQPYQMVKDVRTEVEDGNVASVLDGDLDEFMEGFLRWRRSLDEK